MQKMLHVVLAGVTAAPLGVASARRCPKGERRFVSAGELAAAGAAVVCVLPRDAAGATIEGVGGELPTVAEAFADGAADEPPQAPGQVPQV